LRKLGHGSVLLRYVQQDDSLSIILAAGQSQAVRGYTVRVSRQALNRQIELFREQVQAVSPDVRITASRLYQWLMPPDLRRDLTDAQAKILMVSLDGALRYLPLAALYDGEHWLAEKYAVVLYTEAADRQLDQKPAAVWRAHAFGMTQAVGAFPALAWVRTELGAIVGDHGMPGQADFDADFTSDRLHDALLERPQVLHIASHFVFRPADEDDSFLLLGVGQLSLSEIKRLEFDGLDLLALSACETGVGGGVNRDGREVEGFASLAVTRGASAVLATLWSVADPSTAAFMDAFYRYRIDHPGASKAEMMQATQLAMIHGRITAQTTLAGIAAGQRGTVYGAAAARAGDYSHPFYWAPFVLSGNWL
jgi:CHAT domain-containing protein